jgi:hypothetical protein
MGKWIKHEQFSLDIPEDWAVSEEHESIELQPNSRDAAIHISVLKKTVPSPPRMEEAVTLVENFALNNNLRNEENRSKVEPKECDGYVSMFTAIFHGTSLPSEPLIWVVKSIVGDKKAVLATLCLDDVNTQSYVEGLSILDSLKTEW